MKKSNFKIIASSLGLAVCGAVIVSAQAVQAAADPAFTNAMSSSTAMQTDYKVPIITAIIGFVTLSLVIGLSKVGLNKAKATILGAFAGRRRRR